MRLKSAIHDVAEAAFNAVDDIAFEATYKIVGDSIYNPSTGEVTDGTITSYLVKAIMVDIQSKDKLGEHVDEVSGLYMILGRDIEYTIPTPGDILVIPSGDEKVILDVITDPAQAVWELGV